MLSLNIPLRTAQTILAITVLAINAYVTGWYIEHTVLAIAPRASILPVFVGAFSLLLLPYLFFNAPLSITHANRASNPRFFNKWAVLCLDSVLCVLWFAAWVYEGVFRANLTLCYGHICGLMAWATALGAVVSLLFFTTTILAALHVIRTRGKIVMQELPSQNAWVGMEQKAQS